MNWADFHFIRPYCLLALLPYLAMLIFLVRRKLSHGNWSSVCDAELLPFLLQNKAVKQSRWPLATGTLAALLSIVAMAGPTWERLPTPVFRNDSALVIVLDLSRSMDAADVKPSRLTLARYKIADILKQRKDGQTALLVFADDAFVVTPLTNDNQTIDSQLSALTTSIMPSDGNNIARALEKAKALFQQAGLQKGQILLLTDGGGLDEGKAKAKSLDAYQLLVLGVGTPDGAPIALNQGGFLKDEQGNIIVDKLDVNGLEKLAQAGQGLYQPLTADDTDIKILLSTVTAQAQEKGDYKNDNLLMENWSDKGPWLLLLVLPLAALSFRKGLLTFAIFLLLPVPKNSYAFDMVKTWQDLWQTQDQQAQAAYKQGDFTKAAELFENPDWQAAAHYKSGAYDKVLENLKNNTSANSRYNQGNALAQSGKLQEALTAYDKALKLNSDDADAKYNKELIEKALEKQKQEQKQQQNKDHNKDKQDDAKQDQKQDKNKDSDKSGEPKEQDKSQENKDKHQDSEQKQDEGKPKSKPEQSQESTEHQPEKKEPDKQKQEDKPETVKPEQAEKNEAPKESEKPNAAAAQAIDPMSKEEQQAQEQWLNRIPDDPAGLLRRKFKYQYDQRQRQ